MALRSLKSTRDLITHLSSGVGASQLPSSITKISLTYAFKGKNESAGAKYVTESRQLARFYSSLFYTL